MGSITLGFTNNLNTSLSIGDIAYFKAASDGGVYQIGPITAINSTLTTSLLTCDIPDSFLRPELSDYIFFVKDSEINTSGLTGYFATVKMTLTGSEKKELYAVSTEVSQSS